MSTPLVLLSHSLEEFTQKIILEDFEESKWTKENLKIYSNSSYQPEIKISKAVTSPNVISSSSLFLRFPKETTEQNIELRFSSPKEIEKYLVAIRFQIFANSQGGVLSFLLEDANFEIQRIFICSLNFSGWKEFKIPIGNKIYQADRILNQSSKLRLVGFLYTPALDKSKNREDILALDDIEVFVLNKYKVPENFYKVGESSKSP
ncbi:MAG: flagellar filament outer layer protein FlaA [Leptospiraceae bacterium]|nr:flagellar filament outer layer protein FlaA [Leptospiraceae bacterium]